MRILLPIILLVLSPFTALKAQTVGLFQNTPQSFNGYTLFTGYMGDTVYLIDNCGRLMNKWASQNRSSRNSVELTTDGGVVYGAKVTNVFNSGSGQFEKQDWNGNLVWSFAVSDSFQCAHHGFTVMPNGNILAAVWEKKSPAEQIAAGRNPANANNTLWVDKVMELKPMGIDSAIVVWEWKLWDHLVQEIDPSLPNFGDPRANPGRLDVNLLPNGANSWAHVNNVDYNPELDQVLICSRNFNEIYIVDHSTTTAEAAGSTGGQRGRGGDFLYRWGDPMNYKRGTLADRKLFHQHDAHWIPAGLPDAGKIMIFNNGEGRPGPKHSTVDVIAPPLLPDSTYLLVGNDPYGPDSAHWIYPSTPDTTFISQVMGSAQKLPNGNVLIAESNPGDFQEVDTNGNLVWRYVSPVNMASINTQGTPPGDNSVFQILRYGPGYAGFAGLTLTPGAPIEINPLPAACTIFVDVKEVTGQSAALHLYPNPAQGSLQVRYGAQLNGVLRLQLFDMTGRKVLERQFAGGIAETTLDLSALEHGVYILLAEKGGEAAKAKVVVE